MSRLTLLSLFLLAACTYKKPELLGMAATAPQAPPNFQRYEITRLPVVGEMPDGKEILLGGFSGLHYIGKESRSGRLLFLTHTDRGPNGASHKLPNGKEAREFLVPEFQPRIVMLAVESQGRGAYLSSEIYLRNPSGKALSGLPNGPADELPVDAKGETLRRDPDGLDLEGISLAADGSFWMADEYAPSLVHFSIKGKWIERLTPGKGLPSILRYRRPNRGFEAVTLWGNKLYGILQSSLATPALRGGKSRNVRIIEYDTKAEKLMAQYLYRQDCDACDKIGDAVAIGKNKILVVERDGKIGAGSFKKVFLVSLDGATNLEKIPKAVSNLVETMDPEALRNNRIVPVRKEEVLDLAANGFTYSEKAEGIAFIEPDTLVIANDNDFGVFPASDNGSYLLFVRLKKPLPVTGAKQL